MKVCRVSIIGFPNSGKSTLLSHLLGKRISAISPKKHTTKTTIIGSKTIKDTQLIFTDTPGINNNIQRKQLWTRSLGSMKQANVILYVIDSSKKSLVTEKELWEHLTKLEKPFYIIFSKVDRIKKENLLPLIKYYSSFNLVKEVFPLCLIEDDIKIDINKKLLEFSTICEFEYIDDESGSSLLSENDKIMELIKEAIFHSYHQEIPHQVDIRDIKIIDKELTFSLFSKRKTQKALLIGKGGMKIDFLKRYITDNASQYKLNIIKVNIKVL